MTEKQLGKLYASLVSYYDKEGNPHYTYEEEGIISLLDGAKKEFGSIEAEFFPKGDIPHDLSTQEAELKIWVPRERKLQVWFKKWFGEPK
jgi:hypothetical protein